MSSVARTSRHQSAPDSIEELQPTTPEPILLVSARTTSKALWAKRALDILGATLGLVLLSPVALVIAVVIRTTSRGPVLFRQVRVARGGDDFVMIKFRTMRDGTHREVVESREALDAYVENDFKLPEDDARITRVGRFLRKSSLDEIPQLVNVLRGDMSLVGIRPVERAQLELRPALDQHYYTSMRPGLTGMWQIDGRSSLVHHERLELDREYVENWSLWLDVRVLFRTPLAVLHISRTF